MELSYFVLVLQDLKIAPAYEGFLFLAESSCNPPKLQSHHHIELELNLVVRGTITYVVGGQRFTFPAGTLLWLFPEQEHQLVDRSNNAQNYVVVFKPSFIRRCCRTPAYSGLKKARTEEEGILHARLDPDSFDLIRRIMDSLMEGSLDSNILNQEAGFGIRPEFHYQHNDPDALNAGLHQLLLLCWRRQCTSKVSGRAVTLHPSVQRALHILSEDSLEQNLSELAEECEVSEAYLSRTFHRQVGVPLSRYRNSLRLAKFWEEYRQPEQTTITEAVYAAGFGSYAQFYKIFVEAYNHGPRSLLASRGPMNDA